MIPGYGIPGKHAIGQISDAVNGQALGAIIPVTTSLIAGVARGGASVGGATFPIAVSLKPGYVAAGLSTEGMIPGDAGPGRLALGQISNNLDGHANGALLTIASSLIDGTATSSASANGALLVINESLLPGSASAGAQALGSTLSVTTSIKPGYVAAGISGSSMIPGDEGPGRFVLGQLSADNNSVDANASGVLLPPIVVSVIPGVATASDEVPSVERGMPPAYRHKSSIDGFAQGALITVGVGVIAGHAQGEHTIIVREADGSTRTIGIVGATHEELSDDDFVLGLIEGDLTHWLMNKRQLEDA